VSENKQPYDSFFARMIGSLTGVELLKAEKARLEAFLDAVPGDYCGFSAEGQAAFSNGFAGLLGLKRIESLNDIRGALSPESSAALENMFNRMQEGGKEFTLKVHTRDKNRILKMSGSRGKDIAGKDFYDVLWLEDISQEFENTNRLLEKYESSAKQLKNLEYVLDTVPVPFWIRNRNTDLIWCNRYYAKIAGCEPQEVIEEQKELPTTGGGRKGKATGSPGPLRSLAEDARFSGETRTIRTHSIISGSRRLLEISEIPLAKHEITIGWGHDVTTEEDLESRLNRYETANKELLEQLRTAIAIYASDTSLEFYNSAFSQLWDIDDQWLNTRPKLGDIMEKLRETRRLPEQADFRKFKQSWLIMFTSLIDPHEDMMHLPDGTALRMLIIPHPMGGLMMTFEDVTSRLELESSYNTLIAVQKETLDNLAEGVAVFGSDGRIKLWNPAYANLWGLNPEDLESEPHITRIVDRRQGIFEPEDWKNHREIFISLGLERRQQEGRVVRKNGGIMDYSTVPLPDGGVLITWSDVTDTVRVETALREKNAALEAAERLKLDFLANVSYQLRTPLNAIMGFTEILDNEYFGKLNDRQKEYTRSMYDAGERLLSLINDILDLSTIEAGYMELDIGEVSIRKMLANLLELVRDWTRKEQIEIDMLCPKNIGSIYADERRLKQVLLNIIRNAIDFTPHKGTIKMQVSRTGEGVKISVADNGIGIPENDQQRVFEPFERAHSNSIETRQDGVSARGGAGLGLSLVRNIVELHGGHVTIASQEGKGTTVTLYLPQEAKLREEFVQEIVAKII
jgi:PAS domain S-box-containing protein